MRFLHCSDMHLGAKLSGFRAEGMRFLRSGIDGALRELQTLAEHPRYDGLLFVGDIFDAPAISPFYMRSLERLFQLALDRGAFVVYATGNHDYFITERHFSSLLAYQNFVLFCKEEVERRELTYKGKRIAFYGIGYQTPHPARNVQAEFPPRQDEDIAIALLHGDVYEGRAELRSDYYSASAASLAERGYDYVALGHIHSFHDFGSQIFYPGTPLPQGWDEAGEKFCLSVELSEGIAKWERKPIAPYRIYDLRFEGRAKDRFELASRLRTLIEESLETPMERSILRIKGRVDEFEDFVKNEDADFREEIFGFASHERQLMELDCRRPGKSAGFALPSELEACIEQAIAEFAESKRSSYELSGLDCMLTVCELMQKADFKVLLSDAMRCGHED